MNLSTSWKGSDDQSTLVKGNEQAQDSHQQAMPPAEATHMLQQLQTQVIHRNGTSYINLHVIQIMAFT